MNRIHEIYINLYLIFKILLFCLLLRYIVFETASINNKEVFFTALKIFFTIDNLIFFINYRLIIDLV
jgi:hypothetical protein